MRDNIVTYKDLKCPTRELECILKELICKLSCTDIKISSSFANGVLTINVNGVITNIPIPDNDIQTLSLSGNTLSILGGNSVDLSTLIVPETNTTLNALTLVGSVLTASYTGETGVVQTQSINLNTLLHPELTVTNTTNPFSFNQSTQALNIPIETLTTLVNNNDGTATYTNELGNAVTIPIGAVTAVDNGDGTYLLTFADGTTLTIKDTSISPLVNNGDGTYTYTDEAGVSTTFQGGATNVVVNPDNSVTFTLADGSTVNYVETPTTVTNTVSGHKIADYTNEAGTVIPINETVTSLGTPTIGAGNILTIPFVNENGVTQTVTVDLSGLVTTDVQITNATYDAANNLITITESNGDTNTIDLSEFSIIATTNPDGSITVVQEGVTKFTIPAPFQLTVNAGTTNVATDNSLGQAVLTNNDTLHFWSSDASVNFSVVQGSAEVDVTTNSEIIPFTASTPVGNDAGLASTTVQDAIDEVDGKVEALEDKSQAWQKIGVTNTLKNSDDIFETDNIFRTGTVTTGDNVLPTFGSDPQLRVNGDAEVERSYWTPETTNSQTGVWYKGTKAAPIRFAHNFGGDETFVGKNSGNFTKSLAQGNSGFGQNTLQSLTSGYWNVGLGLNALRNLATGAFNVAVGRAALQNNISSSSNVAVGNAAIAAATGGLGGNTAIGINSLTAHLTPYSNTSVGSITFERLTSGQYNATFGAASMSRVTTANTSTALGDRAMEQTLTANRAIVIGHGTAGLVPNVDNSVIIGTQLLNNEPSLVNVLAIHHVNDIAPTISGDFATKKVGIAKNYTTVGTQANQLEVSGSIGATAFNIISDKRSKKDITRIGDKKIGDEVVGLYTYTSLIDGSKSIGVLGQELEATKLADFLITKVRDLDYEATIDNVNVLLEGLGLSKINFYNEINVDKIQISNVEKQLKDKNLKYSFDEFNDKFIQLKSKVDMGEELNGKDKKDYNDFLTIDTSLDFFKKELVFVDDFINVSFSSLQMLG